MLTTSSERETSADVAAAAAVALPVTASPGMLLRAARERIGLSIGDVAMRLRMGVRQIDALERGDYAVLPTGTFLRGFVRNYAKAVNADAEQAIRLLEHDNAEAARLKAANIVVPSHEIHIRGGGSPLALPIAKFAIPVGVFLLLAAAGWYWWEYMRPNFASGGKPVPASPAATARALATPVVPMEAGRAGDTDNSGAGEVNIPRIALDRTLEKDVATMVSPVVTPMPATAVVKQPVPPTASAQTTRSGATGSSHVLGFTFSGDSWVEVTDASGRIVLSRQYRSGDAGEVSGTAPLTVVIGNAQVTRMADNGKEIELAPHTRVSVARVTIK